ncbi:MAG: S-layer homology domain-containing protein [Hungatella hathewayi]|nr:S-layer homology domain-containing protein [Hungatella hathewayi]
MKNEQKSSTGVIDLDTLEMTDDSVMVADGQYTVATAEGLENLAELVNRDGSGDAENYTVDMLGDIDLQNREWTPIGNSNKLLFQGTFDGRGYTVKNLKISNGGQGIGLFGNAKGAAIQNLKVEGEVTGQGWAGGIVGKMASGTVENCVSEVVVQITRSRAGGIVGEASAVSGPMVIRNCYSTGDVSSSASDSSEESVSGIAGYGSNVSVEYCYSIGEISGPCRVGGIVGNAVQVTVSDCAALGLSVTMKAGLEAEGQIGRVSGVGYGSTTYEGNFGRDDMKIISISDEVADTQIGSDKKDGADAVIGTDEFGTVFAGWNHDIWDFQDDTKLEIGCVLPKLKNISSAQNPILPGEIQPVITTVSLPSGVVGTPYSGTLAVANSLAVTWSVESGSLPEGLTLGSDGSITGTPSAAGVSTFTAKAAGPVKEASRQFSITINEEGADDAERIAKAKAAADRAVKGTKYVCDADEETILAVAQAAIEDEDITVEWDGTPDYSAPDVGEKGAVTGTIKLTLDSTTDTFAVSIELPELLSGRHIGLSDTILILKPGETAQLEAEIEEDTSTPAILELPPANDGLVPPEADGLEGKENEGLDKGQQNAEGIQPNDSQQNVEDVQPDDTQQNPGEVQPGDTQQNPGDIQPDDSQQNTGNIQPDDTQQNAGGTQPDIPIASPAEASLRSFSIVDIAFMNLPEISFTWSSDDHSVATVSEEGLVKAAGPGTCIITARGDGLSAECMVIVSQPERYSVAVENGTGGGRFAAGATVHITASPAPAGQKFNRWSSDDNEVVFADAASAETSFQMPGHTVTVTASYQNVSNGNQSDSSSDNDSNDNSTAQPPTTEQKSPPVTAEASIQGTVDNSGNASVILPLDVLDAAIQTARDTARKNGTAGNGIAVNIHITSGGENVSGITVNLPIALQEKVINENVQNLTLVVDRPDISIGMDLVCVTEINRQARADVQISARRITDMTKLTAETRKAVGDRPVFDFNIEGGGRTITSFGSGRVTVKLPYQLKAGERAGNVQTVYIDEQGHGYILAASDYEEETGMVLFQPSHFSLYAVTYQSAPAFTDTVNDWAADDIDFAVSRGLLEGTGGTSFSPDAILTRGMFVTALGRLAGVDTAAYQSNSFTDVKAEDVCAPYSNWAADKNILNGITATTFAPEQAISREHIAAALSAYGKAVGSRYFSIYKEYTFADSANISAWALPAVKQMQMAGIMMAKNENCFEPQQTVSRREAAVILHRLVTQTMDVTKADGWTQNDSGQWMYYVNDSPVKSQTREIDGTPYAFDHYGVAPGYLKKKSRQN